MGTLRQILVAVKDPSLPLIPGVEKAAQVAKACNARLELFHAMATPVHVDVIDMRGNSLTHLMESERSRTLDRLEAIARRLRRRGIPVTVSFETDFPAYEAIIRRAGRIGADLIVADCHERGHVAASLLRLTDWELLRHSPIPVLLIKNRQPYRHPVVLAAVAWFALPPGTLTGGASTGPASPASTPSSSVATVRLQTAAPTPATRKASV